MNLAGIYADALWEIYKLCGEDTDGAQGPDALIAGMGAEGYAKVVIEAVRQLRTDYDDEAAAQCPRPHLPVESAGPPWTPEQTAARKAAEQAALDAVALPHAPASRPAG